MKPSRPSAANLCKVSVATAIRLPAIVSPPLVSDRLPVNDSVSWIAWWVWNPASPNPSGASSTQAASPSPIASFARPRVTPPKFLSYKLPFVPTQRDSASPRQAPLNSNRSRIS
jgi:hypothetical protein